MEELTRPEKCTDAHLNYLDDLRESGITNMFGAGAYLKQAFCGELTAKEAGDILGYWMDTFGNANR